MQRLSCNHEGKSLPQLVLAVTESGTWPNVSQPETVEDDTCLRCGEALGDSLRRCSGNDSVQADMTAWLEGSRRLGPSTGLLRGWDLVEEAANPELRRGAACPNGLSSM